MPTTTNTATSTPATTSTVTTTATNSEAGESPPWWYTGNNIHPSPATVTDKSNNQSQRLLPEQQQQQDDSLEEWRPHGQGQYYACPGEPQHIFEQRMGQLVEWLRQRPEQCIVLVTHWGVLHYLAADEPDVENCGVVRIDIE
jgi:broad specificity phosphatase PhoE